MRTWFKDTAIPQAATWARGKVFDFFFLTKLFFIRKNSYECYRYYPLKSTWFSIPCHYVFTNYYHDYWAFQVMQW